MIWINGAFYESDHALVSARDRGLLLGDGIFETCYAMDMRVQFWDAHLARLRKGAAFFGIALDRDDDSLTRVAAQLLAEQTSPDAVLRITLTRGAGGRGLVPITDTAPSTLIMDCTPAPARPKFLHLCLSDFRRAEHAPSAQHKTIGASDAIVARRTALKQGYDEAILLNHAGRVACAAAGNVFIQTDDGLLTPPLSDGALAGIMRGAILAHHPEAYERSLTAEELKTAQAIFITNSLIGAVPASFKKPAKAELPAALAEITKSGFVAL